MTWNIMLIVLYICTNRKQSDDGKLIHFAALNDALKQELERLKLTTGEVTSSEETCNMRFQRSL
jgi:hypothetical protein